MKADFTRDTFRKKKHYRRVNKQQGRVDVDADWNEQVGIEIHHERTSLRDVIGKSGAPIENAGFGIIIPTLADNYKIGKGRYYVDGILCENESDVGAMDQPDLPPLEPLKYPFEPQVYAFPSEPGIYLAYLHVWERHLTALDDPEIRESALGGPDTATRTKVVWQVQLLRVGARVRKTIVAKARIKVQPSTAAAGGAFLISEAVGKDLSGTPQISFLPTELGAFGVIEVIDPNADKDQSKRDTVNLDVNIEGQTGVKIEAEETGVSTGIFNVAWRIDAQQKNILIGGKVIGPFKSGDVILATYTYGSDTDLRDFGCMSEFDEWNKLVARSSGTLRARSEPETGDTVCMLPPQAKYIGLENQLYRVEIHDAGVVGSGGGVPGPTFNWSRDNGIVVTRISKIADGVLTVTDTGRDRNLHFAPQQWVEVTDDRHELWGIPGSMVRLMDVQGNDLLFDPTQVKGEPIIEANFPQEFNPKVRRWDNRGGEGPTKVRIPLENEGYIGLESGVQVKFSEGTYHTGDYWLIPARTLKRDIEWPQTGTGPEALPPEGIEHHFSRLAIVGYTERSVKLISDCRQFFPPAIVRITQLGAPITTGTITLKGPVQKGEVTVGPFEHGVEPILAPPAILLAKVPDGFPKDKNNTPDDKLSKYISFMEDYNLYNFRGDILPTGEHKRANLFFKAVEINLRHFSINIRVTEFKEEDLVLRFWAIPGIDKGDQSVPFPSPD